MPPVLAKSNKWAWKKAIIDPPVTIAAGDVVAVVNNQLVVTRSGVVISTTPLGSSVSVSEEAAESQIVTQAIFLKAIAMPGQNVSCTKVQENQTSGAVTFSFSSGNNTELPNWEAAAEMAAGVDAAPEFAEKILMGKAYRESPDGSNKTTQVGASVSVNLEADVPVVYTAPQ